MHEVLKIEGKHLLKGTVKISGSKNATVALIPAAILADSPVTIWGVPNISDVGYLGELLEVLNVRFKQVADDQLVIDPTNIQNVTLDHAAVTKLRASYYFMGALLGRFKNVSIKMPGGCYLGPRPIDLHLKGFEALGATIEFKQGAYHINAEQLIGAKIYLDIASVGATINIMMASIHALGRTIIENAAKEPEIIDVANMLNKMGAQVRGAGTTVITIDGVDILHGCAHEIIPDRIEAGTFIIMAAAAAEEVTIENIIPQHLESLLSKLEEMGVSIDYSLDKVTIRRAEHLKPVDIKTLSYPGFATDLQQPLTPLLTQAEGKSVISETIYVERFKHCQELQRMGANIDLIPATAMINGPSKLYGDKVIATDLRCGAALVIAGLIAEGITEIHDVYHIDRGYDNIDAKLKSLGANIWRETIE
ncbi:MAG: UDP-N-acetylglucosamine 1-carboxyvinyltransferase [Erysipelotrichaceae bacterium]|nr:MAG: UDP-N-acetylglucosamine [Erysipelotrichaceae bacterium]TXT19982.1 MAG: UDP-N-acetylglucosamine 1-carboxyvinyltransferase [Erysipelotrichaceae bacterium]